MLYDFFCFLGFGKIGNFSPWWWWLVCLAFWNVLLCLALDGLIFWLFLFCIELHLHYLVSRALHAHLEFENINLMLYQSILLKLKIRGRFFWLSYKNVIPLNLVSLFVTVWSVFFLHCCLKSFYSNMM